MKKVGVVPDECGQVVYNTPQSQDNQEYTFKIDYQINDRHSLFFRDLFSKEKQPTLTDIEPNLLISSNTGFDTPSWLYAIGETWVASDWKMSGIYKFTSGTPLAIQDGTDAALSTINHQQPDLVDPNNVYTGDSCGGCVYLNKSAFKAQAAGVFNGNLGWNSIVSPTYWSFDMGLSRVFRITERQGLELRADAFNLMNSFISKMSDTAAFGTGYANPPTGPTFSLINSAQFGQILGAQLTRKIQFALKYSF